MRTIFRNGVCKLGVTDLFGTRDNRDQNQGPALGHDLRILDGIASWCGALHGSMSLDGALDAIATALGAEAALISRDAISDGKPRLVAEFDARSGDVSIRHVRRSYAQDVLGKFFNKMRGGTMWFLSDHEDDVDYESSESLNNWRLNRGIADIAVIALESTGIQHDYLEFHFSRELDRGTKENYESVFPTLVRAWGGRQTGLVTQAQMDERMIRARVLARAARMGPDKAILGISNPAKLSRAEFRVCLLLSHGLSVKGVTDELGLSEATVRSHLRSIYSKTETSGMPDLVYHLLSKNTEIGEVGFSQI